MVFDREEVVWLRRQERRQIAKSLGLGVGTVVRTLRGGPTVRSDDLAQKQRR